MKDRRSAIRRISGAYCRRDEAQLYRYAHRVTTQPFYANPVELYRSAYGEDFHWGLMKPGKYSSEGSAINASQDRISTLARSKCCAREE